MAIGRPCSACSLWATVFLLLASCAHQSVPHRPVKIGVTTKAEVVEQYGDPDLVVESPTGDIATYRFGSRRRAFPRVEIPTAQAGPLGATATKMETIQPGLGNQPSAAGRPTKGGFQIRYDRQGIVQELLPE